VLTHLQKARADMATMNRLLPEAERIAREQGDENPSAEHLVAAAFSLDDEIAAVVLAAHGVDRDRWLEAVLQQHRNALGSNGITVESATFDRHPPKPGPATGPLRSQPSLQDAFQRAVSLARQYSSPLNSAHVLLAAIHADHGTVPRTLAQLRIDRTVLAAELRARL
jgi:ATP-dependent Clp protease ATP-binding subunit ClpA